MQPLEVAHPPAVIAMSNARSPARPRFAAEPTREGTGRRERVFCASMADVFEERMDLDMHRARLWDLIAATQNLDWLLLTKRPQAVERLVPWGADWPANV
jgi:protein gp37